MKTIEMGRLLRSSTTGCVVGCRVTQMTSPAFGGMVRIPLETNPLNQIFGLIYDIHIDDDGLVRQLVTAEQVDEGIIQDNRLNRNVPVEISVLFIGHQLGEKIFHLLPPRPPLTLDKIFTCSSAEIVKFTGAGRLGYFRHILNNPEIPLGELIAAHFQQVSAEHIAAGSPDWVTQASKELITLLRDDYSNLMRVLGALADTNIQMPL